MDQKNLSISKTGGHAPSVGTLAKNAIGKTVYYCGSFRGQAGGKGSVEIKHLSSTSGPSCSLTSTAGSGAVLTMLLQDSLTPALTSLC